MRKALLFLAGTSFLLSQLIAAVGWVVDLMTRGAADALAGLSEYLKERAQ